MRLMENEGARPASCHVLASNSNTQLKCSGETTSTSSAGGEEQKANPRRVLGKTPPLPLKPLGNHQTIRGRIKLWIKGQEEEFFHVPSQDQVLSQDQMTVPFLQPSAAVAQLLRHARYSPPLGFHHHSTSVTLCKALAFMAGERFGLQGPA